MRRQNTVLQNQMMGHLMGHPVKEADKDHERGTQTGQPSSNIIFVSICFCLDIPQRIHGSSPIILIVNLNEIKY